MREGLFCYERVLPDPSHYAPGSGECDGSVKCLGRYGRQYRRVLLSTRARLCSREQVGWTMREGMVAFERVRDWEALECQRHICEIQGQSIWAHQFGEPGSFPRQS